MSEKQASGFGSRVIKFLRSMGFGMILLALILILSLIGSLIPQGKDAAYYLEKYGSWGQWIIALQLDRIYTSWYFGTLFALLCINLVFCSILRSNKLKGSSARLITWAEAAKVNIPASTPGYQKWLNRHRLQVGDVKRKNAVGSYGSLITHIGLLLLILSAAAALTLHSTSVVTLHIGDTLPVGEIAVTLNDFVIQNEAGETDYVSSVTFTKADGSIIEKSISVNYPAVIGNQKFYQDQYDLDGFPVKTALNVDGPWEEIVFSAEDILSGNTFLTLDGKTGFVILNVLGDAQIDSDGKILAKDYFEGAIQNPAYLIRSISENETKDAAVFPGTELPGNGFFVLPEAPRYASVLSVKGSPRWVLPALYTSFAILLIGLFLCFCVDPYAISVKKEGIALVSRKTTEEHIETITEQMKEEN